MKINKQSTRSRILFALLGVTTTFGLLSAGYSAHKITKGKVGAYMPSPPRSGGAATNGLGDRTGSPINGSGSSCANCHSGGSYSPTIAIVVKDAGLNSVTSYIPGDTYTIEYSVAAGSGSPSGYGMQSVVLNSSNASIGNMTSAITANSQIVASGGVDYFEHQGTQAAGFFQLTWTAPTAGTGAVSLYARGLAVNGNGGTSGDEATPSQLFSLQETIPTTISYPGTPYCDNESNQSPVQTGETGGAFSAPTGLDIDPTSGVINIANSTVGNYLVDYTFSQGTTTFTVVINPTYSVSTTASICSNETLTFGSQTLDATDAGLNTEIFQSINGCDSTVDLTLTVNNSPQTTQVATICANDTYSWGTQTLDASDVGLNTAVFNASNGCDSTVELTLTVLPIYSETAAVTICEDGTYLFDGQTLDASNEGLNIATFQSIEGCDSVVNLTLNVETIDDQITMNAGVLTATQTGATYQWLDCDNGNQAINNETNSTFTPSANGSYAVEVTLNGCVDTSACFVVDYIGIDELTNNKKEIVKFVDLMGRETEFKPNTPLIIIYSDGSRERVMEIGQ